MIDYHVHTHFSADSHEKIESYIAEASKRGVTEICFTDHYDLDFPEPSQSTGKSWEADIGAACQAIQRAAETGPISLLCGVEMGMRLEGDIQQRTDAYLSQFSLDFIIASVHFVNGADPWYPEYFDDKTRSEGYRLYLETILACLQRCENWQSVGHIDYPAKNCPYTPRALRYHDAPELLDSLFRYVISQGKCIEINGSVLVALGQEKPDLKIYQRYRELGGEYITLGSDAHRVDCLAQDLDEAAQLAQAAGIPYVARFSQQIPNMIRLDRL